MKYSDLTKTEKKLYDQARPLLKNRDYTALAVHLEAASPQMIDILINKNKLFFNGRFICECMRENFPLKSFKIVLDNLINRITRITWADFYEYKPTVDQLKLIYSYPDKMPDPSELLEIATEMKWSNEHLLFLMKLASERGEKINYMLVSWEAHHDFVIENLEFVLKTSNQDDKDLLSGLFRKTFAKIDYNEPAKTKDYVDKTKLLLDRAKEAGFVTSNLVFSQIIPKDNWKAFEFLTGEILNLPKSKKEKKEIELAKSFNDAGRLLKFGVKNDEVLNKQILRLVKERKYDSMYEVLSQSVEIKDISGGELLSAGIGDYLAKCTYIDGVVNAQEHVELFLNQIKAHPSADELLDSILRSAVLMENSGLVAPLLDYIKPDDATLVQYIKTILQKPKVVGMETKLIRQVKDFQLKNSNYILELIEKKDFEKLGRLLKAGVNFNQLSFERLEAAGIRHYYTKCDDIEHIKTVHKVFQKHPDKNEVFKSVIQRAFETGNVEIKNLIAPDVDLSDLKLFEYIEKAITNEDAHRYEKLLLDKVTSFEKAPLRLITKVLSYRSEDLFIELSAKELRIARMINDLVASQYENTQYYKKVLKLYERELKAQYPQYEMVDEDTIAEISLQKVLGPNQKYTLRHQFNFRVGVVNAMLEQHHPEKPLKIDPSGSIPIKDMNPDYVEEMAKKLADMGGRSVGGQIKKSTVQPPKVDTFKM